MNSWSEDEASPGYRELSYDKQQRVKQSWIEQELLPDMRAKGLDQMQTAEVLNHFSTPSPRFEDADTERGLYELGQRFQQGDVEAESQLKGIVLDATAKQASLLWSLGSKLFGLVKEGTNGDESETETISAYQMYNNPEARKAVAYADYLLNENDETRKEITTAKTLTSIGLNIAEWAAMVIPIAGASLKTAKGIGKGAQVLQGIVSGGKSASVLRRVAGDLVGHVTHAAITGGLMAAKSLVLDEVNENLLEDPEAQDFFIRGAKYFGENFFWDAVANVALDYMLPQVSGIVKMSGWGKAVSKDAMITLKGADTPATRRALIRDLFTGKEIPDELMRQLPKADQVRLTADQTMRSLIKKVPDMTPDEHLMLLAKSQGLSLAEVGGKWNLLGQSDNLIKKFDDTLGVQKFLQTRTEIYTGVSVKQMSAAGRMGADVNGFVPSIQANAKVNLAKVAKPAYVASMIKAGDTRSIKASLASILHMGKSALDPNNLSVLKKGSAYVVEYGGKALGELPAGKIAPESLSPLIAKLGLNEGISIKGMKAELRKISDQWGKLIERKEFYKKTNMEGFLNIQNAKLTQEGQEYVIRRAKVTYHGKTPELAMDDFLNSHISKEDLGHYLGREHNFTLSHKDGVFSVKDRHQVLYEAPSIRELLNENPRFTPKLPGDLVPKWNLISADTIGLQFKGTGVAGSYQDMLAVLNKFENYTLNGKNKYYDVLGNGFKRGKISITEGTQKIKLNFEPTGEVLKFDSPSAAREYLKEGFMDFGNLKLSAGAKGYNLEFLDNGNFVLRGAKSEFILRNEEELLKKLREAPIPDWVKEMSGVDEAVLKASLGEPSESFLGELKDFIPKIPASDKVPTYGIKTKTKQFLSPVRASLEALVDGGGDPRALTDFTNWENLRRAGEAALIKGRRLIPTAFMDMNGKMLKGPKREAINEYLRMNTQEGRDQLMKVLKMGDSEFHVMENMRQIYGSDPFKGLSTTFRVDPEKWLPEYLPKIKNWFGRQKLLGKKLPLEGDVQAVLKGSFGGRVPEGMDAFFKHVRVSEMFDIALEKDPLKQLEYYLGVGYREKYMGPQFESMMKFWKKHPDKAVRQRMGIYMGDVMNVPASYQQELLGEIGQNLSKKLFKGSGGDGFFKWLEGSCYLGTMGWRPWMAIRNSHQIWMTLAPLMTNNRTQKALKYLTTEKGGKAVFTELMGKGIINETMPIAGKDAITAVPFLDHLSKSGLKWYKDADSLTRAVAYVTSRDALGDAVRKFPDLDANFIKESRLSVLPKDLRDQAMAFMKKGDTAVVEDMLGNYVVERTMFPYRSGMSNIMYRGTIGKLFGRMGHYPLYYVDNVRRSLMELPMEEKLAYGATWVANSALLYEGYKKLFGVEANQFLFYSPMMFTGGPYYEVMENFRELLDAGPLAKQKAERLFGVNSDGSIDPMDSQLGKLMVPGGTHIAKIRGGVEQLEKGNTWGAMLNFMSMPYTPGEAFWDN